MGGWGKVNESNEVRIGLCMTDWKDDLEEEGKEEKGDEVLRRWVCGQLTLFLELRETAQSAKGCTSTRVQGATPGT